MSNFEMWQELFGDLCEYIDPMDHFKIADKIKSMLDNPSRLDEMSFKGKVVINEQFNWETESRNLEELYSKI
jgi:glycosyltransferase involved in cell wall biosynthesis